MTITWQMQQFRLTDVSMTTFWRHIDTDITWWRQYIMEILIALDKGLSPALVWKFLCI